MRILLLAPLAAAKAAAKGLLRGTSANAPGTKVRQKPKGKEAKKHRKV